MRSGPDIDVLAFIATGDDTAALVEFGMLAETCFGALNEFAAHLGVFGALRREREFRGFHVSYGKRERLELRSGT